MKYTSEKWIITGLWFLPFKKWILRRACLIPPVFKTNLFRKSMGLLLESAGNDGYHFHTNLGIPGNFRFLLPSHAHSSLLFGQPIQHDSERGTLFLCRTLARDSDCFIDVGSYLGTFVFLVSAWTHRRLPVYFIEPQRGHFDSIVENATLNRLGLVKGFQIALSSDTKQQKFFLDRSDDSCSSLKDFYRLGHQIEEINIRTETFAEFASGLGVNNTLLKVDIENAEMDFLEGAAAELGRVKYLVMEVLEPAMQQGFIPKLINEFGMNAYYINDFQLEHSVTGEFTYVQPQVNWLFCRLNPEELAQKLKGSPFTIASAHPLSKRGIMDRLKVGPLFQPIRETK